MGTEIYFDAGNWFVMGVSESVSLVVMSMVMGV